MENKTSYFDLIKQRRFKEAFEVSNNEYRRTNNENSLRNRAKAYLNLKEYNLALADFMELIRVKKVDSDYDYLLAGISYWFLGNSYDAIDIWRKGLKVPYTDAAGGVGIPEILVFAAIALKDDKLEAEMLRILKKKWKSKNAINWPGAIAGYLLKEINEQDVMRSLSTQPILRKRHLCQAEFYIAVNFLRQGDRMGYITHLAESMSMFAYLEPENYLAVRELGKAGTSNKFSLF